MKKCKLCNKEYPNKYRECDHYSCRMVDSGKYCSFECEKFYEGLNWFKPNNKQKKNILIKAIKKF